MAEKYTILIVDDDVNIGDMLTDALTGEGYAVRRAYSGTEAVMLLGRERPDLILLDLMLPGMTGEEVLAQIRDIPTIVLSARADVETKVKLLYDGACDYMTKPFAISELLARCAIQLRKTEKASGDPSGASDHRIQVGGIVLDPELFTVTIGKEEVLLTRTETAILQILMGNPGHPLGRSFILDRIADNTPDCTERSLKQHISNIRKKLQAVDGIDHIEAIYGIGFKFS